MITITGTVVKIDEAVRFPNETQQFIVLHSKQCRLMEDSEIHVCFVDTDVVCSLGNIMQVEIIPRKIWKKSNYVMKAITYQIL